MNENLMSAASEPELPLSSDQYDKSVRNGTADEQSYKYNWLKVFYAPCLGFFHSIRFFLISFPILLALLGTFLSCPRLLFAPGTPGQTPTSSASKQPPKLFQFLMILKVMLTVVSLNRLWLF